MAGAKTATATRELSAGHSAAQMSGRAGQKVDVTPLAEEVPLERYLAQRRPIPHLFDITPDLEPDAFTLAAVVEADEPSEASASLASTVRAQGDRDTDVRLLADDGEQYLTLANDLANTLGCDVYLTPRGAEVRYLHEVNPVTGDGWDAVAVDRATGEPVDWLVVRPVELPIDAATWFVSVRGRLRRGQGLVTVALPDGVGFATRATYRDTAQLASRLMPSQHPLTTVAVNADLGQFEIARFEDEPDPALETETPRRRLAFARAAREVAPREPAPSSRPGVRLGGAEFATLVRASLDVIHSDVQVALTWPKDATACATLHTELLALADGLNRTVWVPEPPGAAFLLAGIGEFGAVDEVGAPSRWRAYPPSSAGPDVTTLFGTDLDGRLSPLGEVAATRFLGVPFVSVPPPQLEHLRRWYNAIAPLPGLFPIDLAVLPDGRLGVMLTHGVAVVAGPRELQTLLREAGWTGEDLLLLAQPPAPVWNTTIEHARALVDGLRADLWLATLGARVWAQVDGTLTADGPDGADRAWCCVAFGRAAAHVTLPPALAVPRLSDEDRVVPRPVVDPTPAPMSIGALRTPEPYDAGLAALDELTVRMAALPAAPVSPGQPALASGPMPALTAGMSGLTAGMSGLTAGMSGLTALSAAATTALPDLTGAGPTGSSARVDATGDAPFDQATFDQATFDQAPFDQAAFDQAPFDQAAFDRAAPDQATDCGQTPGGVGGIVLGRALGRQAPHGVPWLPPSPAVNTRAMDLYLWTPLTSDQVQAWGLPCADLFLLAGQDPLRVADHRRTGYLLRVHVPEGAAVDLHEHTRQAPVQVRQRLIETGETHLLPLAWLRDMQVTARFDLDGAGGVRARSDVSVGELAIRFEGAAHGVSGLPNEVVHWPDKGSRPDAPCYLLLPDETAMSLTIIHGGFVALSRTKPALTAGHRLLEVRVRRRRAIDVPATLDSLAGMTIVGRMHDFVGLDLLLPEADLDKAVVTKIWRPGPTGRPVMDKLSGATLYDALLDESLLVGDRERTAALRGQPGRGPIDTAHRRPGAAVETERDRTPALVG